MQTLWGLMATLHKQSFLLPWLGQVIDGQGQAPKLNVTLLPPLPTTDQIDTSPFPKNSSESTWSASWALSSR